MMPQRDMGHTAQEGVYWLKTLFYLPYFWYVEGVRFFTRTFIRIIIYLDQSTAMTLNLRFFFVPLFGDYSIMGRILALPFRVGRILVGVLTISVGALSVLALFLLWIYAPVWSFTNYPATSLLVAVLLWVVTFYTRLGQSHRKIDGSWQQGFRILDFAKGKARTLVRGVRDAKGLFDRAAKTREGAEFLFRMGPHELPEKKLGSLALEEIYKTSYELARELGSQSVEVDHILAALFKLADVRSQDALGTLRWQVRRYGWAHVPFIWEKDYEVGPIGGVNRGWTGRVTPILDSFSQDLTLEAAKGHLKLMIGKEKPMEETARVLGRERKANVLLVGPPGSGKTALVWGIAQDIIRGARFESFRGKRVIQLDVGSLVAGAKTEGELGERLQGIIEEIKASRGIVLFIDEIHNLILSGGEVETAFVFSSLRPHLETGKLQLLGATSWENYRKYLAPNEAFAQVFELVEVPEAQPDEAVEVLEYEVIAMEQESKKVKVTFPAIKAAVEMSDRLIYERVLPDKAMDLLEETVVGKQAGGGGVVGEEDIAELVSQKTKVPMTAITQKEAKELLNLEEEVHKGLINQEEAVKGVSDALRRARAGLREEEKPIATFLFVGPTGVGKTELSKVLANIYFGGKEALIRVDMSEFADVKNIYRLIGSPPGSESQEPGQLTEAVRQRPFSLILLDEFEKAHTQISNLFLQVFDDGRLTDGRGDTVDFTNTIIIATSNAGTKYIQDRLGEGKAIEDFKDDFLEVLRETFPPELLNRFDGVMVFKPLTQENLIKIVELKIKGLEKDLAAKHIKIAPTEDFVAKIADLGYAPQWGARPLTRVMQDKVEAPLAKKMLAGEIKEGQTVTLDSDFLGS